MSFFAPDPELAAEIYRQNALNIREVSDYSNGELSEMSDEHLFYTCVYRWTACSDAEADEAPDEVLDILESEWLEVFKYKVSTDKDYKERFLEGKIIPPRWDGGDGLRRHRACVED